MDKCSFVKFVLRWGPVRRDGHTGFLLFCRAGYCVKIADLSL